MNFALIQCCKMIFEKIFELLFEINDKANFLRQAVRGNYLIL